MYSQMTTSGWPAGPSSRVLVVDDLVDVRLVVDAALRSQGHQVAHAETGEVALRVIGEEPTDLVILDINLPGMSGLEVLSRLRLRSTIPVILLSARHEESDRVLGLELGADDYVVKPFSARELAARVSSVLRRRGGGDATTASLSFGPLVVRVAERQILLDGQPVDATAKEFDLLAFLVTSPPRRVFSRAELLEQVWSSSAEWQDSATVTEHVRRLRKKIEVDPERPRWLQTVRGVGYRFDPSNRCEPDLTSASS